GDAALFHAPMADRAGNVWIGTNREFATMAHAAQKTVVTVEALYDGNLLDDPQLAAGTLAGFYVEAVAVAPRGSWPLGLAGHYPADAAHLAEYASLAATAEGFAHYLERHVHAPRAACAKISRRGAAVRRHRPPHRRRPPRGGGQCLADPGGCRADGACARQRPPRGLAARQRQAHVLYRWRARAIRLRRPGTCRRVLPLRRPD